MNEETPQSVSTKELIAELLAISGQAIERRLHLLV